MTGSLSVDLSHQEMHDVGEFRNYDDKYGGPGRWYFSRKEIEENSPSKKAGIDLKKESYLRKSYCTFLQDLGMQLKVPQVTIATAIIFCHRFFLRQSHAKNDRRTISTVCMFLAGKVEETPRPLKDVIIISYEIINKKDPSAPHKIRQKELYEQQKEMIIQAERVLLVTLAFDLNVHHPYKPLVEAIKKFKVAQNTLAQVAWNFVNDGLRTSLCLQFKPHHIAAGAIFLAAKFLKVKLPSDGEKVWWQEFDVTPRQLEEVSNQMLELYEQNRVPASQGSEAEGSMAGAGTSHHSFSKPVPTPMDSGAPRTSVVQPSASAMTSRPGSMKPVPFQAVPEQQSHGEKGTEMVPQLASRGDFRDQQGSTVSHENSVEAKRMGRQEQGETVAGKSPVEAGKMIDRDKVKAALKQRKLRGDVGRRTDLTDYEDLIEQELEDGIQIDAEREKQQKQSWVKADTMEEGEVPEEPRINWKRKATSSPERSRVRILLSDRDDGSMGELSLKKMHRR